MQYGPILYIYAIYSHFPCKKACIYAAHEHDWPTLDVFVDLSALLSVLDVITLCCEAEPPLQAHTSFFFPHFDLECSPYMWLQRATGQTTCLGGGLHVHKEHVCPGGSQFTHFPPCPYGAIGVCIAMSAFHPLALPFVEHAATGLARVWINLGKLCSHQNGCAHCCQADCLGALSVVVETAGPCSITLPAQLPACIVLLPG
eukprot:1138600-Pelagomonas_calceolata.AAC.8